MIKIDKNELNIYEVEPLHKKLLDEFKNDEIIVDIENVNKIDMSVIQLFISMKKSCLESSKTFKIISVTSEVLTTFKNAGCEFLLGVNDD